jgi:hypothetical protein
MIPVPSVHIVAVWIYLGAAWLIFGLAGFQYALGGYLLLRLARGFGGLGGGAEAQRRPRL